MSEEFRGTEPAQAGGAGWMNRVGQVVSPLADRTHELIGMGNVRRLVVEHADRVVVNLPLTAVVAVATIVVLVAPWAAIVAAAAALYWRVRVRVERPE